MMRIGINGLGRIGRCIVRALFDSYSTTLRLVAINIGPYASISDVAYALKYDSVMGVWNRDVSVQNGILYIDNYKVVLYSEKDPECCLWDNEQVDWVIEATGVFTKRDIAKKHIGSFVQGVIISAPSADADITVIPGWNLEDLNPKHTVISVGSCTTNAVVPMLSAIKDKITIQSIVVNSIHAYTNNQAVHDSFGSDIRKKRGIMNNIIPTGSGVQKVLQQVMPDMADNFIAFATRIPVPKVSLIDMAIATQDIISCEHVSLWLQEAEMRMPHIMKVEKKPLVATDYYQDSHSVIVDETLTTVSPGLVKLYGWYDNEWGYSMRVCDVLEYISKKA